MSNHSENHKNSASIIIFVTLILSIGYSVLRYHIVGPVPVERFPFFYFE